MKTNIKSPFEMAEIEIFKLGCFDVVTASPEIGRDPFEGEEDDFYWNRK